MTRTYIIKAAGRYVPDYSVYTNLTPTQFELLDNYPNPFNPTTTIGYNLPANAHVKVEVINLLGQTINTLVDQALEAGHHEVVWDGTNSNGKSVASGIYFYRIQAESFTATKKMMLLK